MSQAASIAPRYDDVNDPIRFARNNWTSRYSHVSDSSAIIDSIDVDMIDATQDESSSEVYIVLDTNVLIHQLRVIKQTLTLIESSGPSLNVILLVPGIVVSELDHLKKGVIGRESRSASDWLAVNIRNGRGHVKGQAYTQTMLPTGDWRQRCGHTNDELILDCCKYFGHIKRKDVLLCTMDNNLVVHASSNASNLFARDVSGVIRPRREHWGVTQLLEQAVPGFKHIPAASIHAPRSSKKYSSSVSSSAGDSQSLVKHSAISQDLIPDQSSLFDDDVMMEVEVDISSSSGSVADRLDNLHRHLCNEIIPQLRKLTGNAAMLESRRQQECEDMPMSSWFTMRIPTTEQWSKVWSLRDCLKFVARTDPPKSRSWAFREAEASRLADFLASRGEKGARRGREWSKHDWIRELLMVGRLGRDFELQELDESHMAYYQSAVLEVFG